MSPRGTQSSSSRRLPRWLKSNISVRVAIFIIVSGQFILSNLNTPKILYQVHASPFPSDARLATRVSPSSFHQNSSSSSPHVQRPSVSGPDYDDYGSNYRPQQRAPTMTSSRRPPQPNNGDLTSSAVIPRRPNTSQTHSSFGQLPDLGLVGSAYGASNNQYFNQASPRMKFNSSATLNQVYSNLDHHSSDSVEGSGDGPLSSRPFSNRHRDKHPERGKFDDTEEGDDDDDDDDDENDDYDDRDMPPTNQGRRPDGPFPQSAQSNNGNPSSLNKDANQQNKKVNSLEENPYNPFRPSQPTAIDQFESPANRTKHQNQATLFSQKISDHSTTRYPHPSQHLPNHQQSVESDRLNRSFNPDRDMLEQTFGNNSVLGGVTSIANQSSPSITTSDRGASHTGLATVTISKPELFYTTTIRPQTFLTDQIKPPSSSQNSPITGNITNNNFNRPNQTFPSMNPQNTSRPVDIDYDNEDEEDDYTDDVSTFEDNDLDENEPIPSAGNRVSVISNSTNVAIGDPKPSTNGRLDNSTGSAPKLSVALKSEPELLPPSPTVTTVNQTSNPKENSTRTTVAPVMIQPTPGPSIINENHSSDSLDDDDYGDDDTDLKDADYESGEKDEEGDDEEGDDDDHEDDIDMNLKGSYDKFGKPVNTTVGRLSPAQVTTPFPTQISTTIKTTASPASTTTTTTTTNSTSIETVVTSSKSPAHEEDSNQTSHANNPATPRNNLPNEKHTTPSFNSLDERTNPSQGMITGQPVFFISSTTTQAPLMTTSTALATSASMRDHIPITPAYRPPTPSTSFVTPTYVPNRQMNNPYMNNPWSPSHAIPKTPNVVAYDISGHQPDDPYLTRQIYDKAVAVIQAANKALHAAVDAVWPSPFELSSASLDPLLDRPILFMFVLGGAVMVLVLTMMLIVFVVSSQLQPPPTPHRDDISFY